MDSLNVGLSSATISGDQKLIIHQKIPDGIVKRGPHAIVRSAQLNDCIEIQRRCATSHDPNTSSKSKTIRRSLSTESSSPERYRHRDVKKRSSPLSDRRKTTERSSRNERSGYNNDKHSYNIKYSSSSTTKTDKSKREKAKSPSPSFAKKKPVEKLPYYRDERREKDRLRRLYGRSRSRSPPTASFVRRYSPPPRRRNESPSRRRRSISRDRYRKYSPSPRSSRRDYNRARRSRSRSRTHSPHRRERHKRTSRSSRERDKAQDEDPNTVLTTITQPTPQFIPIPIAVPADYTAYSFHGWPTPQPPWHSTQHRPPPTSHFAPIPMLPMMAPLRPPPQSSYPGMPTPLAYAPIAGPPYRPHIRQRYPPPKHNSNNYQARARKPTS